MSGTATEQENAYLQRVGERLRGIRRQKRMSLLEVEAASSKEFKASVLGAYERGERAISVPRLQRLARLYGAPVSQLLPSAETGVDVGQPRHGPVTLDLQRLEGLQTAQSELITSYVRRIQVQRQDFNGRVLTVRADDLRALACLLDVPSDAAASELAALGVTYEVEASGPRL